MSSNALPPPRPGWVRALYMLLMALAFQLATSVLVVVALVQLVLRLATDAANPRLARFGASLGRYLAQVAEFESFASDALPFPFTDWPASSSSGVNPPP